MGRSSSTMERVAPVGERLQTSGSNKGGQYASNSLANTLRSRVRASTTSFAATTIAHPLIFNFYSKNFCFLLTLATTYFSVVSAQTNFNYSGNSYNCSSNCICLGAAHVSNGTGNQQLLGSLSLLPEVTFQTEKEALNDEGVVYSNTPVKMLDLSTNTSLSFSTYFAVKIIKGIDPDNATAEAGDGMTFVLSADNSSVRSNGSALGIFNRTLSYTTNGVKQIVVEFDKVLNPESPINDISDNHVSFDFMSISTTMTANVSVDLSSSFCAWVEYNNETHVLQVSVSADRNKPSTPSLSHTVDLSEFVDETMWAGFSGASGGLYSNYYIQNWMFVVGPPPTSGGKNLGMIVGLSVGLGVPVLLVACIISFFVLRMYNSKGGDGDLQRGWLRFKKYPLIEIWGPKRFKYKDLSVACKNFGEESKLGKGGFGSVYSGVLPKRLRGFCNTKVAVKKIHANSSQGMKEFMAEVNIITQLRHRNLIQLLGWCEDASKKQYLLVYELMPNRSLDQVLFGSGGEQTASLPWERRFNIVTGIAAAISYLHEGWEKQVIHGDIKSPNIMLDEEWEAKLGDFGLARLVDRKREANTTNTVGGTPGYVAPELALSLKFSDKSDVFAFGVVVLEVACGRQALSSRLPPDERDLVKWVWNRFSKGDLMTTVDPRLEEYDAKEMEVMLKTGLLCAHPYAGCRPSMQYVGQVLAGDVPVPSVPLSMPTLVLSSLSGDERIWNDCWNDLEVGGPLGLQELMPLSSASNNTSQSSQENTTRYFSMN